MSTGIISLGINPFFKVEIKVRYAPAHVDFNVPSRVMSVKINPYFRNELLTSEKS